MEVTMKWFDKKRDLTTDDLVVVETTFGINLPEDYKEKVKTINGGALPSAYIIVGQLGEISYSRNIPLDKKTRANIFEIGKYVLKDDKRFFPVAEDGFGNYFCLDLKENIVVFMNHETDKTIYICKTFTDLLKMIIVN